MTQTVQVPDYETVQHGESLTSFAARLGKDPDQILQDNEREMEREAQGRGFDLRFLRHVKDEAGAVSQQSDAHVFPGQRLVVGHHEETIP